MHLQSGHRTRETLDLRQIVRPTFAFEWMQKTKIEIKNSTNSTDLKKIPAVLKETMFARCRWRWRSRPRHRGGLDHQAIWWRNKLNYNESISTWGDNRESEKVLQLPPTNPAFRSPAGRYAFHEERTDVLWVITLRPSPKRCARRNDPAIAVRHFTRQPMCQRMFFFCNECFIVQRKEDRVCVRAHAWVL